MIVKGSSFCDTLWIGPELYHAKLSTSSPYYLSLRKTSLAMFRRALLSSARAAARSSAVRPTAIAPRVTPSILRTTRQRAPIAAFQCLRCYSASAGLSKDEVEGRIMDLLKNFDKVSGPFRPGKPGLTGMKVTDASKVWPTRVAPF